MKAPAFLHRGRRLRRRESLRRLVREVALAPDDFVSPIFLHAGSGIERPIAAMPGQVQRSVDRLTGEIEDLTRLGIPAVLLFGIPASKDGSGAAAWDDGGPVPEGIGTIRRLSPTLTIIADVCLCEYTSHGHCGVLAPDGRTVDNDATLELLGRAAVAYADAGADVVAPSAMMDGQVAAIRRALDAAGHESVAILSYASKLASVFYGPFRDAAGSTPAFGDRRDYQLDPANAREAVLEALADVAEGADALLIKPAGLCLDILYRTRTATSLPLAAYQVSGEYSMIRAAAERGWLDERRAVLESLLAIRRSGADFVITYFAKAAAEWLADE